MKTLTLVRHARAAWNDAGLPDAERPLEEAGRAEVAEVARRFAKKKPKPELVVSSSARRAIETVAVIAHALGYPQSRILEDEDVYDASTSDLLRAIRGLDERVDHALICGHNPGLTDLVHLLTGRHQSVPTCAVIRIELDVEHWGSVSRECGKVVDFDAP